MHHTVIVQELPAVITTKWTWLFPFVLFNGLSWPYTNYTCGIDWPVYIYIYI